MLRLFDMFGRSAALAALDDALRASGVHPVLVPEAVKLTVLRLHRREGDAAPGYPASAALLGYCILGPEAFVEANGVPAADQAEDRLEAAIDAGASLDARLILLALHAGLMAAEIAERFDVEDR